MELIIFNPSKLNILSFRDKDDPIRKIRIRGHFRHTHIEAIKFATMFEIENDFGDSGKVSLYLNEYELERLHEEIDTHMILAKHEVESDIELEVE